MNFPSLFISHGSPMILLEQSPARSAIQQLATDLPRPEAIIIMTAHWLTGERIGVSSWKKADLIYDFYGFPDQLYQFRYPAEGHPILADNIISQFKHSGIDAYADPTRGLDHGSWSPLLLMYPEADIPVVQLSVPHRVDNQTLLKLGEALAVLRDKNLLIGSGLMTHNLGLFQAQGSAEHPSLKPFLDQMTPILKETDKHSLANWDRIPGAGLFHPTDEHLRPLLFAAGAAASGQLLHRSVEYGCFAMDMWAFNDTPAIGTQSG